MRKQLWGGDSCGNQSVLDMLNLYIPVEMLDRKLERAEVQGGRTELMKSSTKNGIYFCLFSLY